MKIRRLHRWDVNYREAVAIQERLAAEVIEGPPLERAEIVAAADVSAGRVDEWIAAAVVVMRFRATSDAQGRSSRERKLPVISPAASASGSGDWSRLGVEVVEVARAAMRATWPYVPGCLSFREVPVVLAAFRQLRTRPDVVLCDGQGRAHPRRFGLACHVGLALGVPTIGCAKSLLVGEPAGPLGEQRGSRADLLDAGERIGTVLRTRTAVKPVYVSVGHRIDLASAERLVLAAATRYRLPEPSRLAHHEVTLYKRELAERGHP